jgi:hypothetical protein
MDGFFPIEPIIVSCLQFPTLMCWVWYLCKRNELELSNAILFSIAALSFTAIIGFSLMYTRWGSNTAYSLMIISIIAFFLQWNIIYGLLNKKTKLTRVIISFIILYFMFCFLYLSSSLAVYLYGGQTTWELPFLPFIYLINVIFH